MQNKSTTVLKPHPLNEEVYGDDLGKEFIQSIADLGILTPLTILSDGTIISGHRRWRAAKELGLACVPVQVCELTDKLEIEWAMIESNRQREKTFSQKMREAEELERIESTLAKERQGTRTDLLNRKTSVPDGTEVERSDEKVARRVGLGSKSTYRRAQKVWQAAKSGNNEAKELVDQLDKEETTITGAVRKLNKKKQEQERKEQAQNIIERPPTGQYRTLVIDPPWPVQKIVRDVRPKQDVMDYPTMELSEIAKLPVPDLAYKDGCHVYLWVTHKFLPEGLELFEKWGVKYQCVMTWKKNVGITPFTWMYDTEHVLFGRIGSLKVQEMGLRLSFEAPVTKHSEKPEIFYKRVKEASPEPRLELFARIEREGFEVWGNEVKNGV